MDRDVQGGRAEPGRDMTPRQAGPGAASVARAVLITIGLVALALLLWAGRNVLFVLFFGLLVGVFLSVFVDRVEQWSVPRPAALAIVLVALVALAWTFLLLVWPTVREQMTMLGQQLPEAVEGAGRWLREQGRTLSGHVGEPANDLEDELRARMREQTGTIIGGALPIINTALGAIAGVLVVLAVGVYTALDPGLYRRGLERLVPPRHRERAGVALDRTGHSLRRWMIGTLINMILVGLATGIGLWLLGIPAPVALAVIAGLLEFVPIVGPILASIPAIILALTVSPMTAVWVTLFYVVIQQLESNVLTPIVMRGTVRLPPALTVLFQTFMAVIFGFLGLLLAVPILAVVMVWVKALYVEPMEAAAAEGGTG
jgi:predicted PurR-regulated permease PerM